MKEAKLKKVDFSGKEKKTKPFAQDVAKQIHYQSEHMGPVLGKLLKSDLAEWNEGRSSHQ